MAWAANVQKSRDLYDSVVRGLHDELDKEIRLRKELQAQVNELQVQLSDAEAACAQLDVYKNEAQNAASREQQLLLEKTTLEQQVIEFTHDRNRVEREMDRMHDDVVALREQLQRAGEASDRERRRADQATLTKLEIEKEYALLQSKHYKSEAMLDELTRRHSASEHASVAVQQDLRDLQTQATSLREECEQLRHDNAELLRQNHEHAQALVQSRDLIAKYEGEIRLLETSKNSLLESLSVEREETAIKQRRINGLEEEKAQLSHQLEDMANQHSAQLMDASALATVSIEQQLRELKLEFEQTTTRWAKVEQEKRDKESDIKKLQNALEKEKQVCYAVG
jgi:chromosome segregation ATPase